MKTFTGKSNIIGLVGGSNTRHLINDLFKHFENHENKNHINTRIIRIINHLLSPVQFDMGQMELAGWCQEDEKRAAPECTFVRQNNS